MMIETEWYSSLYNNTGEEGVDDNFALNFERTHKVRINHHLFNIC